MKVLYLAHYKESTGWAQAAIDYILALDSVGVDVVCRNISLTGNSGEVPERILELEQKSVRGADVCIQHVLPHHLVGSDNFKKNIGFFVAESEDITPTPWSVQLRNVDELWVPNVQMWEMLHNAGISFEKGCRVVPHTFDMDKYSKKYPKISNVETDSTFNFYFIGDMASRKNIECILRCFHSEFDISEPVSLICKLSKFGLSPEQVHQEFDRLSSNVKGMLRMYTDPHMYKKEAVIPNRIPEDDLYALHQHADCFISPSHGEAWSIPAFDAMAFGNTPICSDFGGPSSFIDKSNKNTGWAVGGSYSVCTCPDAAFEEIFTGRENWFTPDEKEIKKAMRYYYENKPDGKDGLTRANEFSYESVGNMMKEYISEITN